LYQLLLSWMLWQAEQKTTKEFRDGLFVLLWAESGWMRVPAYSIKHLLNIIRSVSLTRQWY